MAITSSNPIIVPEVVTPAVVYDKWWITSLSITAPNASQGAPCSLQVTFQLYSQDSSGIATFAPNNPPVTLNIDNIFNLPSDPNGLASGLIDQVIEFIGLLAQSEGVIS